MKTRIITALAIIACVLPPLIFGGWLLNLLVAFIIIEGGLEFLNLRKQMPFYFKVIAILAVFMMLFVKNEWLIGFMGVSALLMLSIPVFDKNVHSEDVFIAITYYALFIAVAKAFLSVHAANQMFVWFVIFATYLTDTGAYFSGFLFGKHKLNERISPKKTWEGSIWGWLCGTIISSAVAMFILPDVSLAKIVLIAAILCVGGQLGDLLFSSLKRDFDIKDYSNLFPGHGGVLDRVDSFLFNFVAFYLLMLVLL